MTVGREPGRVARSGAESGDDLGVDDLTHVAQDYLKVIWSAREWGGEPITTKALATHFATTQPNVSDTMRRLQTQGLVSYEPYRPVTLTELGERLALAMVRRHRLIETFLVEVVGYGWEEVHDEAERLEHAVSEDFLHRIDVLLGHPSTDPHGDPIPDGDGWLTVTPDAVAATLAGTGSVRVVRVDDADPERLVRLRELGVGPGSRLEIGDGGIVAIDTGRRLSADEAQALRVVTVVPDQVR